jgi:hypothetical protein
MPLRSNLSDLTYKSRRNAGHRKREINPELRDARLKANTVQSFWAATRRCPSDKGIATCRVDNQSTVPRQESLSELESFVYF